MSHTESLRVPAGTAINEPQPDFYTAIPSRTFIQRAPAGPSYGGPRPGFHTVGPSRALIRQILTGPSRPPLTPSVSEPHSSASPTRDFIRRALPDCLSRTFMSQGPSRVFIRRAPVGHSDQSTSLSRALRPVGGPQSCFHRRTSAFIRWAQPGLHTTGTQPGSHTVAWPRHRSVDPIRAFIQRPSNPVRAFKRRAQAWPYTTSPSRALRRQTSAGPSIGGHRPGFQTAGAGGLSVGGPWPGFHMAGLSRAFIRQSPVRLSLGGPQPSLHTAGAPAGFK